MCRKHLKQLPGKGSTLHALGSSIGNTKPLKLQTFFYERENTELKALSPFAIKEGCGPLKIF